MDGETDLVHLIKNMTPKLNQGEYVFVTMTNFGEIDRKDTLCEFKEEESTTLVILRTKADELNLNYDFIASWITLKVHSSLYAVGLTAIFSTELAKNNISCNVMSGYFHDHIFVAKKDAQRAMQVLASLSKNYP